MQNLTDILKIMQQHFEGGNITTKPGLKEAIGIIQDYISNNKCDYEYSADVGGWKPVPEGKSLKQLIDIGFNIRKKK